jgi:lipoprotein-anchoring transpeptidase ErfK/SrfK
VLDSVALGRRVWLKVQLPIRPNGSSGWIPASRARLRMTRWRIRVSVGERAVRVYRSRRLVRRFRAVVGAPSTPTPHGEFAVSERIAQPDPHGFLGPWALHLTAFSDVLEDFGGGPGRIGLHGRDGAALSDPLGSARSHGCIRVDNAAVRFLARVAVPGTPVHIGR